MNFALVNTHYCPRSTITANFVWYSNENILFRRHLETLVEEEVHAFPAAIATIWAKCGDVCSVGLNGERNRRWYLLDDGWASAPASDDGFYVRKARYMTFRVVHGDYWQLQLVSQGRAAERARRLIKDEALAARVCHYLE